MILPTTSRCAEDKLAQLMIIDEWHMRLLAALYSQLKAAREGDASLLDRTMVLYGSNLGDANAHSTNNLPVLLAGGGFRHGQHLSFDRQQNHPLPNLFVPMLHRMGIEAGNFASSTGTMWGLEMSPTGSLRCRMKLVAADGHPPRPTVYGRLGPSHAGCGGPLERGRHGLESSP